MFRPLSVAFFRVYQFLRADTTLLYSLSVTNRKMVVCRLNNNVQCCVNRLTPNDPYMGRTAPLTSKRCILYIYSTNVGTEYFKHAPYSPFFSLQNAVCFTMLTCLVPVLFTFYIQCVLKLKKKNGSEGLILCSNYGRQLVETAASKRLEK